MDDRIIPTLTTERLRLRPLRAGDIDDYAALYADPEVTRGFGLRVPFARDADWRHMTYVVGHWHVRGFGEWAVEDRATGAFLGLTGFVQPEGWPGFELAWALARHAWGHGYATEGARAALDYAFTTLGRDRVISLIRPENRASIRVALRLGEYLQGSTEWMGKEFLVYGIERADHPPLRTPRSAPTGSLLDFQAYLNAPADPPPPPRAGR